MDDARSSRIGGWSGVVFSLLSLIVVPLLGPVGPPALGSSGEAFATYFAEHRVGFLVGNYLGVAAFFPGFVQLAVLASRVRRSEGDAGWLASLILTTGTFCYAVFVCSLVPFQALPFLTDPAAAPAAHAVGSVAAVWFSLDGLAAFPFVVSVAWAARSTGMLPAWFTRFSVVVAVVVVVMSFGSLTTTPVWLAAGGLMTVLGFVMFFVWTLALAIAFLRGGPEGRASAPPPAGGGAPLGR